MYVYIYIYYVSENRGTTGTNQKNKGDLIRP